MKLLDCLPKAMGTPVLVMLTFVAFGFVYFAIWYIFKVIITTIYVMLGVSVSYLMDSGGDDSEDTSYGDEFERGIPYRGGTTSRRTREGQSVF